MKSEFKYFILLLVLESVASLPTYNGELLTDEFIPPPKLQQYSYNWNGHNGPLQAGSFPGNVQVRTRSFPENVQVQPQYDIEPSTHQPAYGPISFGNYHQTGLPAEQKLVNLPTKSRQQNVVFHPKYGLISAAQQYQQAVPANTARDMAIQQQLANQQAELNPQNMVFHPTYGPISAVQQYQQTTVPINTAKDIQAFQQQMSAVPHYEQTELSDKIAREMTIEQQLASQQAEQIPPNIANYVMRHPAAINKLPIFSQPQFVQNPPQISGLNKVPTPYSNFAQYQQFEEPMEIARQNNVVKTLPLVSAAPQQNLKKGIMDIRENDMEHSASNNIQNRLNNIHSHRDVIHTELKKNSENSIQNRISNANKQNIEDATNANAVKNLYSYLNRQFEKNSSWPSYYNVNQLISSNPEIINALVPSKKTGEKKYIVIHADGTVEHVEQLETVAEKFPDYVLVQPNNLKNTVTDGPDVPSVAKLPETQLNPIDNENKRTPDITMPYEEKTQVQVSSSKTEDPLQQQSTYLHYEVPFSHSTTAAMVDNKQSILHDETESTNSQNTKVLQTDQNDWKSDGQPNTAANSYSISNISHDENPEVKLVNQDLSNVSSDQDTKLSTKTVADSDSFSEPNIVAVPVLDQNINRNYLIKTNFSENNYEKAKFSKSNFNEATIKSQPILNSASNVEHEETRQSSSESSSLSSVASETETIQNDNITLNGFNFQDKQDDCSTKTHDYCNQGCNCKKNKIIQKRLNDRLDFLSDELIKIMFMSSMVSQSTQGEDGSNDEKSKKPLVLLDTNDPNFLNKVLGNDTSSLVYFFQAPTKLDDKENSFSEDTSQNA